MIVKFPDKEWARLATLAEHRGISIAELLVEAAELSIHGSVTRSVQSPRRTRQALDWDEVARLNREGLSDSEIARQMNRPHKSVANARRTMKLPANFGPGGRPLNTNRSNAA